MFKREVTLVVTAVVGFVVMLDFFVKFPLINKTSGIFQQWGIIVSAFALGLASINLMRVHVARVVRRTETWFSSLILLIFLIGMSVVGIAGTTKNPTYAFWYAAVFTTCHSTVTSLLAFYLCTASYRSFKVRNLEATLLLVSAAIVMLARTSIGEMLFSDMPVVYNWFMNVVNMAGQRGIMITSGVGAIAASLRVLTGLERNRVTGG